jgi:hypothetical protein
MDNLINGLVRERAQAAALQLELDFVSGSCLLPGLGLGLSFQFHPGGVFAAGVPFGLLCRDALRRLIRPCYQLVQPRCQVVLGALIPRVRFWIRAGNGRRIYFWGPL